MTTPLATQLGLGERELVSLVGGGGKSTLLLALGRELAAAGNRVILTTTTKMGREQADAIQPVCWSADVECAAVALEEGGPVMLVTAGDAHKVTGPPPELVDDLFAGLEVDYVIVEADGSKGRPLKAPAGHEPVVPAATTMVVILVGIDAVGRALGDVAHRVTQAQRFLGVDAAHVLTPEDCAAVILHPDGALRECPPDSRVVVAITKVRTSADQTAAVKLAGEVRRLEPNVGVVVLENGI